jgi:hypothetical protein
LTFAEQGQHRASSATLSASGQWAWANRSVWAGSWAFTQFPSTHSGSQLPLLRLFWSIWQAPSQQPSKGCTVSMSSLQSGKVRQGEGLLGLWLCLLKPSVADPDGSALQPTLKSRSSPSLAPSRSESQKPILHRRRTRKSIPSVAPCFTISWTESLGHRRRPSKGQTCIPGPMLARHRFPPWDQRTTLLPSGA